MVHRRSPDTVLASARLIHSERAVAGAIDRMADRMSSSISDKDPVILAVMNGGAFIAAELCKRFAFPYEFDYVHLTRYGRRLVGGDIEWRVPPSDTVKGRTVVIVDDVLDRGTTLRALLEALTGAGATEILTAVLVRKRIGERVDRPGIDFVGLETDDIYLFGCGMDVAGYWRGLPALYGTEGK